MAQTAPSPFSISNFGTPAARKPAVEASYLKFEPNPTGHEGAAKVASVFNFSSLADKIDTVKVVVGNPLSRRTWAIHQHLLTAVSDFARVALSWGGKEQEAKVIELPEEDPDVFEYFVKYVYTSIIDVPSLDRKLHLYVLADRLQATELCRKVHFSLTFFGDTISNAQMKYVLENTAPGDALRHSCLDKLSRDMAFKAKQFPIDFSTVLCENYASEILAKMMGKYDAIILAPSQATATTSLSSPVDKAKKSTGFGFSSTGALPQGQSQFPLVPPFGQGQFSLGRPPPRSPGDSNANTDSGSGLFRVPVTTTTSSQSIFGPRSAQQNGVAANSSTTMEASTPQITTATGVSSNNSTLNGSVTGVAANASLTTPRAASSQSATAGAGAGAAPAASSTMRGISLAATTSTQTGTSVASSQNLTAAVSPTVQALLPYLCVST
ncbi:hypothetical protein H2200_003606 [Cladophialophora chaetospira]|uniref:BTB domain-containing protein n=1 Tax=Cladophialophora chaetospira TaxID=386627 RepID=A0AA38XER0_9EURO|nr:hypothetical protein H2200_003606 [Cladophialophora chaetospira]